jgi:hypothetical protein
VLGDYGLTDDGRCRACGTRIPGVFAGPPSRWGRHRLVGCVNSVTSDLQGKSLWRTTWVELVSASHSLSQPRSGMTRTARQSAERPGSSSRFEKVVCPYFGKSATGRP